MNWISILNLAFHATSGRVPSCSLTKFPPETIRDAPYHCPSSEDNSVSYGACAYNLLGIVESFWFVFPEILLSHENHGQKPFPVSTQTQSGSDLQLSMQSKYCAARSETFPCVRNHSCQSVDGSIFVFKRCEWMSLVTIGMTSTALCSYLYHWDMTAHLRKLLPIFESTPVSV